MHLGGDAAGQTPLEPDEAEQLIPSWISTRGDLDSAEQENIAQAAEWTLRAELSTSEILVEGFLHQLHRRMFGEVWRWAGSYRTSARNIGVEAWLIADEVGVLLADVRYWVEHETYPNDELAVRFHHRLVAIHAFPNGNGRHARLAADLLIQSFGAPAFSWGIDRDEDPERLRNEYIAAIFSADAGEIEPLLEFARS
ncbi:MAG: mobile mystery protein B [Actinobacteria bacterium]|nr:mobile mystery protein B [Actinomycetota bacterium]